MPAAEVLFASPGSKSYTSISSDTDLVADLNAKYTTITTIQCARYLYIANSGDGVSAKIKVGYLNGGTDIIQVISPCYLYGQFAKIYAGSDTTATNIAAFV